MKKSLVIVLLSFALVRFSPGAEPELKDQKDKVSYSIGLDIGNTLKRQSIDVNESALSRGIQDGLSGGKSAMTEEQMKDTMQTFRKDMMAKQETARKTEADKNTTTGQKFLEENKKKA
ncbi:MAG TPA: FKBP-type peptidyl-prolyl cis-trans isomerase N-terminal domain-containing protein, partial [Chthoniobacterales bacterium]|nr:FKBP-type peptidyl-prolyl cis-trans isomerase N-terminal domain-containing protein [Chthoniobacterales bacterium]